MLSRAAIVDRRMASAAVVVILDILEHCHLGLGAIVEITAVADLVLERPPKALGNRVVPAVASTTHAASDLMLSKLLPVRVAGVLAAAIGVMHQAGRRTSRLHCHGQRAQAERRIDECAGRPADDGARIEIDDR